MTQPLVQKFPLEMVNEKWLKNSMHLKTSSFSVVPALRDTNRQWIYGGLSEHLWKDDKSKQQPQLQCFYIGMFSTNCGSTLRLHSAYGRIMNVHT